jgi:hypothetical protein
MSNVSTSAKVEVVWETPDLLDEAKHYNNVDLVREINRLKKELYVLRTKKS